MHSFSFTRLFVLCVFIAQAFSDPNRLVLEYHKWDDGSYGWQVIDMTVDHMTNNDIRNAAVENYEEMVRQARLPTISKQAPSVMAALYVPTQHGGVLVLASSIKGLRVTSEHTETFCNDQHNHGNCAEMNAFALLDGRQIDCRNSYLAAYGMTRSGTVRFQSPCRDGKELWGCGSFCAQNSIQAVTKRSRIEFILARTLEERSGNWTA